MENVDAETASMFIAYNFKRLLTMFFNQKTSGNAGIRIVK